MFMIIHNSADSKQKELINVVMYEYKSLSLTKDTELYTLSF